MTLEVCVVGYWSDVRDATVSVSVAFHSLQLNAADLTFVSSTYSAIYSVHYRMYYYFSIIVLIGRNWRYYPPLDQRKSCQK